MMEQTPDNTQQHAAEEVSPLSVGSTLREAREHMELTVEDVVNRLKFAPRQIRALEADDFDQLPAGAFLRGFVRSYARLLQLDEAPLLAALPDTRALESESPVQQSVEVPFPGVYSMRKSNIAWLTAALLVAVALGLFTWLHGRNSAIRHVQLALQATTTPSISPASTVEPATQSAVAATTAAPTQPVAPPTTEPAAAQPKIKFHASAGSGPIHMIFDAASWVEVEDGNGKILMSQINPAGSEQYIDGTPPFTLTIGQASGVRLYYKGKQVNVAPKGSSEVAHVTLE